MSAPVVIRHRDVAPLVMALLAPFAATCRWRESIAANYTEITVTKAPDGALPFKVTIADAALNIEAGTLKLIEIPLPQRDVALDILAGITAGRVRHVALFKPGGTKPVIERITVVSDAGTRIVRHTNRQMLAKLTPRKGLIARRARYAPYR